MGQPTDIVEKRRERFAHDNAPAPERSVQQRMDALDNANKIRTGRAQLKRDIKAGRVQIITLLNDPPELIDTMKLFDLLLVVPKIGRVKANKMLNQCRISPSKRISGMSERQRGELVTMMQRRS